jgi:hypothetical protein
MTPQEIINEIQKLPPQDRQEIKDSIEAANAESTPPMSEEEFLRMMYAKGIIGNIPDLSKDDDDWVPIEIKGKPTSEIIIEDRS